MSDPSKLCQGKAIGELEVGQKVKHVIELEEEPSSGGG